ncbi:phosphatase PAP2 family protein [Kitasatospora sp. NPDC002965]|uniref:phosphatase PAP2 family protein n=1 Tax=Kitasatospora sp. NPDC002965 TaxID=3154775 RepID=UPI0033A6C3B0
MNTDSRSLRRRPPRRPLRAADRRFGRRLLAAAGAFTLASVPAGVLLVLIEARWTPLAELDRGAADRLHTAVLGHPALLSVIRVLSDRVWDPVTLRLLVAAAVGWLLYRRAWRLAAWAAATEIAAGFTGFLVKAAVGRVRPSLPDPVALAPGYSFPSGHAMTAAVSCAVLLLVLEPVVPRALRPAAWAVAAVSVLGVGFTRVALGVHWASDVLGGWLLGAGLVVATAWAFDAWRLETGRGVPPVTDGLEPELATAGPEGPEESAPAGR